MTTQQSEQDELAEQIEDIIALRSATGKLYVPIDGIGYREHKRKLQELTALIHQREQSLLDEVEKQVIGQDEPIPCLDIAYYGDLVSRNYLRYLQRQTLQAIRKERGLIG